MKQINELLRISNLSRKIRCEKWPILAALVFVLCFDSAAYADFCVTTQDVACDGNATTNSGQTGGEDFATWYVYWNAGSTCNQALITITLENSVTIWAMTLCGCGNTSFNYPTANVHTVTVKVQVERCTTGVCTSCVTGSTPIVKVFTPAGNACATTCQ